MSEFFNTNNEYAKKYDTWRRKEELQHLKDRYGHSDIEDDSSSSSDSDSEDDPMLTDPKLQEDWLKTLTALKTKDPRIYQKDYHFFENPEDEDSSSESSEDKSRSKKKEKKKEKPMYLKDYERKFILEKGGVISSDEEDFPTEENPKRAISYHQEQEELRNSVVRAAADAENDDDDDDDGLGGGLLLKRKREIHDVEREMKEDEEINDQEGVARKKRKKKTVGIEPEPLNTWDIPNLDQREKFLKNFILGQAYKEKDKKRIPTYDEVVYGDEDEQTFQQEENFLEKAEQFEKKHNFRFEEYGSSEVKFYPREIKDLVRRKDNKRSEKRNATKERKLQEKEKKKEDIKRLKNLKRQEILAKIEKLKAVTGNDSLGFDEDDLEGDFDPSKHDEMMEKQFNAEYYDIDADEAQKPVFDMSDEEDNWDNWTGEAGPSGNHDNNCDGNQDEGPHVDDPNFCMDADYDPSVKRESRKKMKKKRNKKKLNTALEQTKPVFDPNDKTFEEYIEEYYNLDYEDIIDDVPCRFKYRKVIPNSFGLTADEILNCNEKELNTWVSLKKISQYRTDEEEKYDIKAFSVKARNEQLKKKIFPSLYERDEDKSKLKDGETEGQEGGETIESGKKKRKKGKKKKKNKTFGIEQETESNDKLVKSISSSAETVADDQVKDNLSLDDGKKNKKKKKKRQETAESEKELNLAEGVTTEIKLNESVSRSENSTNNKPGDKWSKKNKRNKNDKDNTSGHKKRPKVSNSRLKAYGINPKKFKLTNPDNFQYKYGKDK